MEHWRIDLKHITTNHDAQKECYIIQFRVLSLPEHWTELGQEGHTRVMQRLLPEIHLYRLWSCGMIEVSINHSAWVEYLSFPPKDEPQEHEQPQPPNIGGLV